jgi:hypothetical protein
MAPRSIFLAAFLCAVSLDAAMLRRQATSASKKGMSTLFIDPSEQKNIDAALQTIAESKTPKLPPQEDFKAAASASPEPSASDMAPDYTDPKSGDKDIIQSITDKIVGSSTAVPPGSEADPITNMANQLGDPRDDLKEALTEPVMEDSNAVEEEEEEEEMLRDIPVKEDAAKEFLEGVSQSVDGKKTAGDKNTAGEDAVSTEHAADSTLKGALGAVAKIESDNSRSLMRTFVLEKVAETKKELEDFVTKSIADAVQPMAKEIKQMSARQFKEDITAVAKPAEPAGADKHGCNPYAPALFATKWDQTRKKCVTSAPESFDDDDTDESTQTDAEQELKKKDEQEQSVPKAEEEKSPVDAKSKSDDAISTKLSDITVKADPKSDGDAMEVESDLAKLYVDAEEGLTKVEKAAAGNDVATASEDEEEEDTPTGPAADDADTPAADEADIPATDDVGTPAAEDLDTAASDDVDTPAAGDAVIPVAGDAGTPASDDADIPVAQDAGTPAVDDVDILAADDTDTATNDAEIAA